MQALTKTPLIDENEKNDTVSIYATIPAVKLDIVKNQLENAGGVINQIYEDNDWIDAHKYFNLDSPDKKYDFLKGARYREDFTQKELSEKTGIPTRHISEMENKKRPIGKMNAKKLAAVLNCDYRRFL